jgi:hypothetical protein
MKEILICFVSTLFLFSGCGFGSDEEKISVVTENPSSLSDLDVDIAISEGDKGVVWPEGLSSDIPEFLYGKIDATFDGTKTGTTTSLIKITNVSKDAFSKYAKDLRNNGWEVTDNILKEYNLEGVRLEAINSEFKISLDKDPVGENTAFLTIEKL